MLKEREAYTATKGVENEGYDFEVGMLSFYCFHLCYNDDIADFKIAIYDDQYHPFDDIVIEITTDVTEKYAIQLKHVKDKLLFNANHFGKNGKMVLSKYFKYDFSKSHHVLLLTNGVLNEEITVGNCHMEAKTSLSPMEQCLDTCCDESNHIYEIWNDETSDKITFYTSQKSRYDIDKAIKQKFKEKFFLNEVDGVVQKFKNFFQLWKKGNYGLYKLDKQDIKMKIAEILFYDHIADYQPQFERTVGEKIDVVQNVLNSFNITIVQEIDNCLINGLCHFNLNNRQIIADGQNFLILANDNTYKELAMILWRLKKFPLIVGVSDKNKKMICELIWNLQEENLSFVLIGHISKDDLQVERVFENLKDLEGTTNYKAIIKEFKLSIQEQGKISLEELIKCNRKFSEIVTIKELLQISTESLVVGEQEDPLPEPYISRRLVTKMLKISSLENFPNELFVISGCSKTLRKKLPKCKFWKFEDFEKEISLGNRLPPKSIILCDQRSECFSSCLKYKNSNVHCLKVVDQEYLQLIYSKEKNENLRQFQIISEDKLYEILKNNINLVCAGPGMGKMTMLKYLKKNCPPGYWTIKVDLQENNYQYYCQKDCSFTSKVRDCFKEVQRMILFFCGIDNLQEDKLNKAAKYIIRLATERNFKVWVFSEDHLKETLEKKFKVASVDIEKFTEKEQQKYIEEKFGEVNKCLEKQLISFKMLKNDDILGAPMHLYMLTEIFIKDPKACIKGILVLTDIYRYFIKIKYEHYLSKVSSEQHNQIVEDGIYYRTEQYKLAATSCLDSVYFKNVNVQCDENFLNQIKKIGDVVGIILKISSDGSIIFSQQTYADYFAALWLVNNFPKVEDITNFIFKEEFKNIFFMFNLEVCKNHPGHIAVLYRNYEQLQQCQNNLNELDPLKRSVLHLACLCGTKYPRLQVTNEERSFKFTNKVEVKEDVESTKILDFLTENFHFDPFLNDKLFNWNLLDYAFNMLNIYAIEKILSNYQETSSTIRNKLIDLEDDFFTIIYYCVKFGYINLLKLASEIPSFSRTVSVENCRGESLLYLAVKSGNCEIVTVLLNKGTKIDTITSTHNKRGALHQAVESDNKEIVKLLLEQGAFVDIMDRYRTTPLHVASSKGAFRSAELLLKYGADVNFSDNFGRTPLQLAATHGQIKILELLLDAGARFDKSDRFGNTAFSCARDNKHEEIVNILSREGATTPKNIRKLSSSEFDEYTSHQLHWVAFTGQTERIVPLLQDGWDINEVDHLGRTPLHKAVTGKRLKGAEMLLERHADVNIPDERKITPLCKSISNGDYEMTNLLLKSGAYTDIRDNFNYTPLHWAAIRGNSEIVKLLLDKNPDVDALDNFGRKPINCAVEMGHYEIVALLENEPDLKLTEITKKRKNFLDHYAAIFEDANDPLKLTSFQEAVNSGNYSLVAKFIRQEKNLNEVDVYGYSVLRRAVIRKHRAIVELLLQKGADIYTKDSCQTSVLHLAALCGNVEIVKLLLKYDTDVNAVDSFGYTPLELAAMSGNSKTIIALLDEGASVDLVDSCGNSPLDWASKKGHVECVEVLMNNAGNDTIQENFLNMVKKQQEFLKIINLD